MGRLYDTIDDTLAGWIAKQRLFFVATAPTDADGHLNLSPKGAMDTFCVLNPTTVAFLDLMGSGIETVAHLRENGRIVVMFCAFEGPPKIVRLHGRGRVVQRDQPESDTVLTAFEPNTEIMEVLRSIIVVEVTRITDSCGFVVPRMAFIEDRQQLFRWADVQRRKNGAGWKQDYARANNRVSIDGLAGLDVLEELTEE